MEELATALFSLAIAVVGLVLHVCFYITGALIGSTFLASRRSGIARIGYGMVAVSCAYFLFGIIRFLFPALSTPTLYGIYTTPVFIAAVLIFFAGIILAGAAQEEKRTHPSAPPKQRDTADQVIETTEGISQAGIAGFAVMLVIGVLIVASSTVTTTKHQSTLRDRACEHYETRLSEGIRERLSQTRDLAERLLDRQIASDITCSDES